MNVFNKHYNVTLRENLRHFVELDIYCHEKKSTTNKNHISNCLFFYLCVTKTDKKKLQGKIAPY